MNCEALHGSEMRCRTPPAIPSHQRRTYAQSHGVVGKPVPGTNDPMRTGRPAQRLHRIRLPGAYSARSDAAKQWPAHANLLFCGASSAGAGRRFCGFAVHFSQDLQAWLCSPYVCWPKQISQVFISSSSLVAHLFFLREHHLSTRWNRPSGLNPSSIGPAAYSAPDSSPRSPLAHSRAAGSPQGSPSLELLRPLGIRTARGPWAEPPRATDLNRGSGHPI